MKKLLILPILAIFLLISFFLGSRMLLHHDFFYLSDQARDFTLVRDIVVNHKLTLIGSHSGLGGLFHGPLWLYLLIPFYIIGKGDPVFFTFAYILIPCITIIAGFFVGKSLYGTRGGTLLAFFLSINAILWSFTTSTQQINLMPLLSIVYLLYCIKYIRGDKKAYIFITFFSGLAFQLEAASAMALLVITGFVFFYQIRKMNFKIIFLSILSFVISISTFLLFDLRHRFIMFTSLFQLLNQNQGHKDYSTFMQRVLDHGNAMIGTYLSILFTPNTFFLIFLLVIVIYACYYFFTHRKDTYAIQKEILFNALFPVIVYGFYLLYPHPIYREYVLGLTVPLLLGLSVLFLAIWRTRIGKSLVSIFIIVTVMMVSNQLYIIYHTPYHSDQTGGSFRNQQQVIDWIWNDAKDKPFGYFVYTPETFTYGTDYLFIWEAQMRHTATPESQKQETTYLIMSPPLANDNNAHQFWKTNTIHTNASVIFQKIFAGNVIVEKLHIASPEAAVDPNYYQNLIFR